MRQIQNNDLIYFIIFVSVLLIAIFVKQYFNRIERKEQHQLIDQFIESEFSGTIENYQRISRGFNLNLQNIYVNLGIEGISLTNKINIGDSIVKFKGNPDFYIYKDTNNDNIFDNRIIIKSGY